MNQQTNSGAGDLISGEIKPVLGLPFKVGERKTFHDMSFIEILPTGKINGVSLELLGPVARTSSEYAEFIVRACNAHDDLVTSLNDLYTLIHDMGWTSPDDRYASITNAAAVLAKAGVK